MRAVVQRVLGCSVQVEGRHVGRIERGLCLLVAVHRDDQTLNARKLAEKLVNLRIFNDTGGKMNLSLLDIRAEGVDAGILAISNFTVYGDATKSRRPSFTASASFSEGQRLFEQFLAALRETKVPVASGEFGSDMQVSIVNDGPVTLIVEG